MAKKMKGGQKAKSAGDRSESGGPGSKYPRSALKKALRIPRAILEQHAGKPCSEREAAEFAKVGWHWQTRFELRAAIRFGYLDKLAAGKVQVTDLARKILRPQTTTDEIEGLRQAILNAPVFADVYKNYRGENLPEAQFFRNALVDTFKVPSAKVAEFIELFTESLKDAGLIEEREGKTRVLDVTHSTSATADNASLLQKMGRDVKIDSGDTCFVIMPFGGAIGSYFASVYEPAIRKAGLTPSRADSEIFGTGKIIDQIWRGITTAKVLVAELTTRNPNVFYELGLAHALKKPVVMVSGNGEDVPFDLRHIRVIYYDTSDPFWGQKLVDKIAENILSALKNPEEALFATALNKPEAN